jgi:hypothetical protein
MKFVKNFVTKIFKTRNKQGEEVQMLTMECELINNFWHNYSSGENLANKIAEIIAEKIWKDVKEELLTKEETTKLLNEIRLMVAGKIINNKMNH